MEINIAHLFTATLRTCNWYIKNSVTVLNPTMKRFYPFKGKGNTMQCSLMYIALKIAII
jgi:hypothetical protein